MHLQALKLKRVLHGAGKSLTATTAAATRQTPAGTTKATKTKLTRRTGYKKVVLKGRQLLKSADNC